MGTQNSNDKTHVFRKKWTLEVKLWSKIADGCEIFRENNLADQILLKIVHTRFFSKNWPPEAKSFEKTGAALDMKFG